MDCTLPDNGTRWLKDPVLTAGTIVHLQGFPVRLTADTPVEGIVPPPADPLPRTLGEIRQP